MRTLPKTHVQFCNMLYSCIDLTNYEGRTLRQIIEEETNKPLSLSSVEGWLRGLPSACTIPSDNAEVFAILASCGNGHWSIDDYWRFSASRVLAFAQHPKAYE